MVAPPPEDLNQEQESLDFDDYLQQMMEAQAVEDNELQFEKPDTPTMYKIGRFALQNRITKGISSVAKTTIAVA